MRTGSAGRVLAVTTLAAVAAAAGGGGAGSFGSKDPPSDARVAKGLKEALRVGAGNAVGLTGRVDGYFKNEAIKILMPEKLRPLEKGLRRVGLGSKVDELVLGMNRAAERSAPFAKEIFFGAIRRMSFEDARKILSGGDTAATDYFKSKTTGELTAAFQPTVKQSMGEVGATRQYEELAGRYESLPFARGELVDLDAYVVSKALGGLFLVLGDEERKIRKDPAARVTNLLKEVFGKAGP